MLAISVLDVLQVRAHVHSSCYYELRSNHYCYCDGSMFSAVPATTASITMLAMPTILATTNHQAPNRAGKKP